MNLKKLFALVSVGVTAAIPVRADLITFDEEFFDPYPDDPITTPYPLSFGVNLSFQGLNHWWPQGGDPTGDQGIAYGGGGNAVLTFSAPVQVPSLFVNEGNDGDATGDRIIGSLLGVEKFNIASPADGNSGWQNVIAGLGLAVDRIEFTGDFTESWMDGITVTAVPEPATMTLVLLGAAGLALAIRRKR